MNFKGVMKKTHENMLKTSIKFYDLRCSLHSLVSNHSVFKSLSNYYLLFYVFI